MTCVHIYAIRISRSDARLDSSLVTTYWTLKNGSIMNHRGRYRPYGSMSPQGCLDHMRYGILTSDKCDVPVMSPACSHHLVKPALPLWCTHNVRHSVGYSLLFFGKMHTRTADINFKWSHITSRQESHFKWLISKLRNSTFRHLESTIFMNAADRKVQIYRSKKDYIREGSQRTRSGKISVNLIILLSKFQSVTFHRLTRDI